jgi:hypothetical protein
LWLLSERIFACNLPFSTIRLLSKCVMINFGYHKNLGDVKCSD